MIVDTKGKEGEALSSMNKASDEWITTPAHLTPYSRSSQILANAKMGIISHSLHFCKNVSIASLLGKNVFIASLLGEILRTSSQQFVITVGYKCPQRLKESRLLVLKIP